MALLGTLLLQILEEWSQKSRACQNIAFQFCSFFAHYFCNVTIIYGVTFKELYHFVTGTTQTSSKISLPLRIHSLAVK